MGSKTREEAIREVENQMLEDARAGFVISNYEISVSAVGYRKTKSNGSSINVMQSFYPPKPEFEAGIVGEFWNDSNLKIIGKYSTYQAGLYKHFTPLKVYAELEQTRKALEKSCKGLCSIFEDCDACPIGSESAESCNIDKRELVAHFLKEAGDGKE